jgi:4-amino-4-deoxy-L-arabinose transferase-like glycosyltransferase
MFTTNVRIRTEILLLVAVCGFLFFYGLRSFGLVGADEPRYAQIAREMLNRSDWVTPTLDGKPWLEKPPLYYWQAMLVYGVARDFVAGSESNASSQSDGADGVSEETARLPAAIDAVLMIAAIYFFLRRFRPGAEVDGALITASCAGVIGFARAAATDMPLTATFAIAMLAWYGWYESRRRAGLAVFYVFLGLGILAKGPVAPVLAAVIVILFAVARRDWKCVWRTIWLPGIVLFLLVALPWYVAVQRQNPGFFRFFILEHNLARFSTSVYHHPEPFWFYLPVFLLAMTPWTMWLIAAVIERARLLWQERRESERDPDNAWGIFLIIWMIVPVVFFSASQSKLPGYILPAVPAGALLVTDYLAARREENVAFSRSLAILHGMVCGLLVFAALAAASVAANHHLGPGMGVYVAAAIGAILGLGVAIAVAMKSGPRLVRPATLIAVVVSVAALIRLAAPVIDATQSARATAQTIRAFSHEPVPVALYHVNRTVEYGLEFYLNRPTQKYEEGQVPSEAHLLVTASSADSGLKQLLDGRKVSYLTSVPARTLELYWVGK